MSEIPGNATRTRWLWRSAALTVVAAAALTVLGCGQEANDVVAPPTGLPPAFNIDGTNGPDVSFFVPDALGGDDARWTAGYTIPTSVGTGVINPFLDLQSPGGTSTEEGFNTDGTFEYNQHRTSDTNPLPLNIVPVISVAGGEWREFVLDSHEADDDFVINEFEVYLCESDAAKLYTLKSQVTSNCSEVYEAADVIDATDQYSSGSGNVYDYRILIPEASYQDAIAAPLCEYDPAATDCHQYIIVWSRMTDAQSTFEEFATLKRPQVKVVKTPDGQTVDAGNPISFTIVVSNVYGTATGVVLDDDLPGGTGISWTDDSADCTISAGPPQHLHCDIGDLSEGETFSVTVTSQTTQQSCAVYDNTASVTSTDAGSDDDDGQITVANCTGTLQLKKIIVNDDGGSAVVGDFNIVTNAGTPSWSCNTVGDTTTCTSQVFTLTAPFAATFAESDVAGYAEGTWSCTPTAATGTAYDGGAVTVGAGIDVVCEITNDDQAASLTLVKKIINDDGGSAVVADFGITTSAGTPSWSCNTVGDTTTCTSQTFSVNAGSSTFAEIDVTGYTEGSWDCTPVAETSSAYDGGAVTLANGESTTCTIENDDQPAHIILIKRVDNLYGGTATAADFNIQLNGGGVTFGAGSTVGTVTSYSTGSIEVDAGLQSFSEIDFAGYIEGTWSCSPVSASSTAYNNGSVDLGNGETTTCEITNTEEAPPSEETAYAFGSGPLADPDALQTECFIPDFSQWGWTNQIGEGVYVWPVYAGAGGCEGGQLAGYVTITYSGGSLSWDLDLEPGFTLVSEHVYAGSTQYPLKNGVPTVAPGQYYIESSLSGTIWVIYHAVVSVSP